MHWNPNLRFCIKGPPIFIRVILQFQMKFYLFFLIQQFSHILWSNFNPYTSVDLTLLLKKKLALHVTTAASFFSVSLPSAHKQCGLLSMCHSICVCLLHHQEPSATCSQWESFSPIFSFHKHNKTKWQESTF